MGTLKVQDQYRTNPLSLKPGGYEVTVVYSSGKSFVYDKVKKPSKYVYSISIKDKDKEFGEIVSVYVDGAQVWSRSEKDNNPWDLEGY